MNANPNNMETAGGREVFPCRREELSGLRALVVGMGDSGVSVARFLAGAGAVVTGTDQKPELSPSSLRKELEDLGVRLVLGGHPLSLLDSADLVLASPGVSLQNPLLQQAAARGLPVLGELEFASRFVKAPLLAVTGTNGKSTVVSLLGKMLEAAYGEDHVFVGGNLGLPLSELAASGREVKAAVVEVSSFQLETVETFHPRVAVILNISPDHLDRHRDLKEYADIKWRIFKNQAPEDCAVINQDDPEIAARARGLNSRIICFSLENPAAPGMSLRNAQLVYETADGQKELVPLSDCPLHGRHNLMNIMAAYCAARAFGVSSEQARAALREFKGLPHRMELVRELDRVRYFNDSKATNPGAVEAAVKGLDCPVILIMGGQAKGCSFAGLAQTLRGRVRKLVAFGEAAPQIARELGPSVPVEVVDGLSLAVEVARKAARPGDCVLLSPGGASFDQFRNYKERGEEFRRLVMELAS